ncbi:MAG: hypothetical protein P4L67_04860 [Candidatus Pacebacteria bacterium]|nr:hypothetical protein [Candidatus Paceibacterota bacterium]
MFGGPAAANVGVNVINAASVSPVETVAARIAVDASGHAVTTIGVFAA